MKAVWTTVVCMLGLLLMPSNTMAAWWEFGRQDSEPAITELRFNAVDSARFEEGMVLGAEDLQNGVITVRGRAEVRRGEIGLVEISLDGGKAWTAATLGERGLFTWEFRPILGREYPFRVRAFSTTGASTGREEHDFTLVVSASDGVQEARETFRKLLDAYQRKDRSGFLALVSKSFEGNIASLEDGLSGDFRFLDSIVIQATVTRIVNNAGMFELYFTYNRQVRSMRSGAMLRDSSASIVGFRREPGGLRLVRMSAPLIFGVSEASDIATSVTGQAVGQTVLRIDPVSGQATTQPQSQTQAGSSSTTDTGTRTLSPSQSYNFDRDTITRETAPPTQGDILAEQLLLQLRSGVRFQVLPGSFSSTTTAPASGYANGPIFNIAAGRVYALEIAPGPKYAVIEIISVTIGGLGATVNFRFKYQSSGSRNF